MGFKLLLNNEEVFTSDKLVKGISVRTRRGEKAASRIAPDEGALEIHIDEAFDGGYPDLDAMEAVEVRKLRDSREDKQIGRPSATEEQLEAEDEARAKNAEALGQEYPPPTEDTREDEHLREIQGEDAVASATPTDEPFETAPSGADSAPTFGTGTGKERGPKDEE